MAEPAGRARRPAPQRRWRAWETSPARRTSARASAPAATSSTGPSWTCWSAASGDGVRATTAWGAQRSTCPPPCGSPLAEQGVTSVADDAGLHGLRRAMVQPSSPSRRRSLRHRRLARGVVTTIDATTIAAAADRVRERIADAGGDPAAVRLWRSRRASPPRSCWPRGRRADRPGGELPAGAGGQGHPDRGSPRPTAPSLRAAVALHRSPAAQQGPPDRPAGPPVAVGRPAVAGGRGGSQAPGRRRSSCRSTSATPPSRAAARRARPPSVVEGCTDLGLECGG